MKIFIYILLITSYLIASDGYTKIKIATYNVENLFDLKKNGNEFKEYIPYTKSKWNKHNYDIKLKNISRVIKEIDADILLIQEIESEQALQDLQLTIKKRGIYYKYKKIAKNKNTNTKVAVLSKIPFIYARELQVTSSYKYRNIQEIKFEINNQELYIFNNHWKAKTGSESKRIISAKVLKRRVSNLGLEKNIILVGDFNSNHNEYKTFIRSRRHNDTDGKTGINHILKTIKQDGSVAEIKYTKGNFYNLWYDTKQNQRFSYIYKGKKQTLDNILISQSLINTNNSVHYVEKSMKSYKPKYLFKRKRIFRWKINRAKVRTHQGKGFSDHLGISCDILIKKN